jgi:hypothetical protein
MASIFWRAKDWSILVVKVHHGVATPCPSDNTVHIVYLTQAGTIAHTYRTRISGNWTAADLGAF